MRKVICYQNQVGQYVQQIIDHKGTVFGIVHIPFNNTYAITFM